ncbi:BrnT family toxin [Marinobacter salarius]|uniref:BrnT family toxin n=1 Tax=Marinobacter salarius TaxID=1420917 RepID=UPI001D0F6751|nr:BrnT family toxin [Marinobacter salarius]
MGSEPKASNAAASRVVVVFVFVCTISAMKIEFDPGKDALNSMKHGVSLEDAALLEWDFVWATEDARNDYGERRMTGYGPIGSRVYCVVYTERGDARRIISFRKANRREVKLYADKI